MKISDVPTRAARLALAAKADRRGVSAVEFALVLPIMVGLYLGGVELSRALEANRRVSELSRTIADIVSKSGEVTSGELSHVAGLAGPLLGTGAAAQARIRIYAVWTDANLKSSIDWSYLRAPKGGAGAAHAPGDTYVLPDGLEAASRQTIAATVDYTFTPTFGVALTGPIALSQTVYLSPRSGKCVKRSDVQGQSCSR